MSEYDSPDFFDPVDEINRILSDDRQALPSVYKKLERLDVVGEGSALVASANKRTLPTRRVGRFEMLEVLERSLSRTVLNIANPGQRVFTAIRELSDFVNMATTGAQPKIANAHRDLLPVGHPLSTKQHNFSTEEVAQAHAEWMSADPRIAEEFRPLVASAFVAPASSIEREYVIAKLEATSSTEVPRDIILGLTADADPYGGGNSFLARSARAKAQRRDRKGRFAYMGGGAKIWLGKQFSARSTLFRFAGYDSKTDSFDLEGLPNTPYQGKVVSVPASKVEAIKAILPELPGLKEPASKSVAKDIIVDPSSLTLKDAPTGWTKVSSENGVDTFRSADGWIATRYPNSASAPNEPSITRVRGANVDKSIDPDLPVYHIAKGSNDGLVTDKPFASTQSWGDTQALISRYDKKTNPKPKATLEEQPEEFLEGWTKGEGGYIPGKSNSYTEVSDRAGGKDFYTDPSGRYVAVKLATPPATWQIGAEQYKQTEDERTRKQVLESGLPIETFDGAQKWDGNVDNLYRLERVKSDGKRELLGFYQDPDDIEKDTEIPLTEDKSQDFYESVIADTLQNGGNTIDFVDGNWPEDGYIVAHEADILKQDGTLGKREELVTPEDFADPIEGPKRLRDFVLKNQDKLNQQGFYLGTWLDTVPVKDENGTVVGEREMVFLDVSEYEADFDKAFDKAEARKEIAIYGVATYDKDGNKGTSLYVADEKRRREIVRKTPVFDEKEEKRVRAEADKIIEEENKWFSDNRPELQKTVKVPYWLGGGDEAIINPALQKDYPEVYRRLARRFEAEKSRGSVFREYIRSVFQMSDGMDPGGRNDGLSGESLRTRDNYVGNDKKTLEMNKALRDGGEVTSKVQKIDTLVKKSKVKDDTQFFRGAWLDPELVKDMGVGDMFFDRAFQSMGLEEDTASSYLDFRKEDFPNKSRVIFRLLLPKGMNAIHVGDDEVIARRNTKMRIIRKSELDGTTYFDVDVEPQTKEEIDARIQGRVPKPEQSKDATSSSELPANDGGGADGLGNGGPLQINYGPKPTGQGPDSERVTDPNTAIWLSLAKDELGVTLNDIIGESIAINQNNDPEKHLAKRLKKNVAESITDKLRDVDNEEFLEMAVALKMYFRDDLYWDDESLKDISTIPVVYRSEDGNNTYSDTIRGLVMSGPMGNILPQDLIDRLNTERISRKDAKEVVRLMNESGRAPYSDIVFVNKDTEEYMYILREKVASDLVAQWASTSNGGEPMSLAIQDMAFKEFDIDRPAEWRVSDELKDKISEITNSNGNLLRRFLRAQYERTQEYFQKKGISKVTLFRGVKNFTAHDMTKSTFPTSKGFTASIRLRPMSSWSTSEGTAIGFARGADSKIFRKEYDVKDILAFPGTGFGCYDEKEMVVLGGVTDSVDIADYNPANTPSVVYNSPELAPITYKEDQPQIQVNNAPVDLSKIPPDDGGDEPELDIFELEGVDIYRAEIYKAEVSKNIADSDEMANVENSQFVKLGIQLGDRVAGDIEWGTPTKDINEITLVGFDYRGKLGDTEDLSEILYYQTRDEGEEENNWGYEKGGIGDKIITAYRNNKKLEISKQELAEFLQEYNEVNKYDPFDSYLVQDVDDEYFMSLYREDVVSELVHQWAQTSNDSHAMSLAIQEIASEVFDIKEPSQWILNPTFPGKERLPEDIAKLKKEQGEILEAFVKAQYRLTQEWFEERGIDKISVYRGIKDAKTTVAGEGLVKLRPLSSWSTNISTAIDFTRGKADSPLAKSMVFRREVDVKEIFSTPLTGVGCIEEYEVVLLGGKKMIDSASPTDRDIRMGVWPKAQNNIPVNNAPMSNFAPKKGKGGLSKEIERRQRLAQQQQEEYAKRLEEQEKAKENIKGQVEANKEELERQIPQIAQSLPTTIDDLFDPNYPLNVLNSRDITQEVFGATNSSDIRRPSAVAALEPDQNWKDLIKNLESLGLADAQDIENEVNSKFNASLSDIRRKRKNASESRKTLENALVSVEGKLKAVEDELILNNFGLDRPQSDPATTQGIADVKKRVSDLRAWAEEYYHQKTGQAVDAFSTPSPLFRLVSVFHGQNERSEEIMQGAVSQLSEIGKLQDSRERQKGYDRVIAKIILGTYMLPYSSSFRQSLENLKTSPAVETLLGRKIPALVIDSALNDLKKKFIQLSEDSSKEEQAVKDLSYEVSKIIKEKLTALGVRFKHNVEISASDINYLGTGEIDINALVAGKPKSEWFKRYNTGEIAPHLSTAQSMAAVLTEALQAFPEPVALVIKKFIVEHPEIMFAGGKRGFWSHTPKDRNIDKVQYVDPADEYMSLTLDGRTKERSVNTASHELTHLLVTQILPQLQPVEWAVLSSFVNQYDADGNIKHDLINGNGGDILIGGEISTTSARDASGLAYRAEASVYTPKVASPYSTKYQIFGNIPGLRVNGTTGLMPYGHGEFLSTLTESMFNGSNQVFYGQRGVSPGDRVRIGYNADGTVKYFTIPDSPIFNAGALPVGIAISLLMNQLAKDKLEVI